MTRRIFRPISWSVNSWCALTILKDASLTPWSRLPGKPNAQPLIFCVAMQSWKYTFATAVTPVTISGLYARERGTILWRDHDRHLLPAWLREPDTAGKERPRLQRRASRPRRRVSE